VDNRPQPAGGTWRWYLAALGTAVGAIGALNAVIGVREHAPRVVERQPPPGCRAAADVIMLAVTLAGLVGVGLAARFLSNRGRFRSASRPRIQPQVLLTAFLVFLIVKPVLEVFLAAAIVVLGFDPDSNTGAAAHLFGQVLSLLGAFALGMRVLYLLTSITLEDAREIGLKPIALGKAIGWGIGGYCAAIPFAYGTAAVLYRLHGALFKHAPAPQHPVVPEMLKGPSAFVVAVVLAVVVAPVVEETVFRGMLYGALRGIMRVWGASVLSGAIFALVHPITPMMFLPLLTLGTVFAVLREATGSLVPPMICHALNNAVVVAVARLSCG